MFPPHDISHGDRQLVDYLLNRLPPGDLERLEEATVVDDDVAARLRMVEHDLVDAYARGSLTGDTLARFELHYLESPRRREQVRFSRKFVRAIDGPVQSAPAAPTPNRPWLGWTLAAAAALLLAASGGLLMQTLRLGRGLTLAQNERAIFESRARDLEQKLAEARAPTAAARPVEQAQDAPKPAAPTVPVIALILQPQTRAIGPIPSLTIPGGADRVRVELQLESNDVARYQVGLRDPAVNRVVWRSTWLTARSSAGQSSVVVAVPAKLLEPQHYSLDLMARGPDGGVQAVGSYAFEVAPR